MSGLTRKKITVRSKKGKTYQRSVMVRAEKIGKRGGSKKLNAMNPGEHGGSSFSWMAHAVANKKASTTALETPIAPSWANHPPDHFTPSGQHANARRAIGVRAVDSVFHSTMDNLRSVAARGVRGPDQAQAFGETLHGSFRNEHSFYLKPRESGGVQARAGGEHISDHEAYRRFWASRSGGAEVRHVPQDPRRHVR